MDIGRRQRLRLMAKATPVNNPAILTIADPDGTVVSFVKDGRYDSK